MQALMTLSLLGKLSKQVIPFFTKDIKFIIFTHSVITLLLKV